jgi:hypothetical protein
MMGDPGRRSPAVIELPSSDDDEEVEKTECRSDGDCNNDEDEELNLSKRHQY